MSAHSGRQNRLSHSASPYLLQHQSNPVEWYEWGPEALDRAQREDRPIFLSIGYAACHWCHVMAHESFENLAIAEVLNRLFVNIKVDREERPDLDEIYMQATMIINDGQGGWPMSVWLTPDLKPFFAGTYFPPESRWGRPGFGDLCERIGHLWREKREQLSEDAGKLADLVQDQLSSQGHGAAQFTSAAIDRTVDLLTRAFDAEQGGLPSGGTNKFPPSMAMDLMLRSAVRRGYPKFPQSGRAAVGDTETARIVERVETTLDHMSRGGIYDHLAGGIARYSTDRAWLVPHFEKMLYDQALVSRIYVDAWQLTRKPRYAATACGIFDYVLADLQHAEGGFFSARDADSEGEEGKYYVWTKREIVDALGETDAAIFCSHYGVSDAGNWQDPHAPAVVKNILHMPRDLAASAALHRIAVEELETRLKAMRTQLLQVRSQRVPPLLDDKILCEWNGLMIASLARGGAALGQARYVHAAERAGSFLLENQQEGGRLSRSWRNGRRLEAAFLSDYACVIEGLIELYEATFERRWLDAALVLNDTLIADFADRRNGGFYNTSRGHERLIARSKSVRDSAVPSGNSVQLMNLLRLSALTGDPTMRVLAEQSMNCFAAEVLAQPGIGERFLQAVCFALEGAVELAIVGRASDVRTTELLRAARTSYLPNRVIMLLDPSRPADSPSSPLLEGRTMVTDAPAAYVCRAYSCQRPVTTADDLLKALNAE